MSYQILVINPGSTSTKIAIYEDKKEVFSKMLEHPAKELEKYAKVTDEDEMRQNAILSLLEENGIDMNKLSAVVGRGGHVPKIKGGAYKVNELMKERLRTNPVTDHAANLGALVADAIAGPLGIPAYIYDSVRVDDMKDVARITGLPEIERTSTSHVLNSRAMAIKVAEKYGKKYGDMTFVIAHLGGGISVSVHEKGKIADVLADDEGPFSPERVGTVPCAALIDLCYSGKYDRRTLLKIFRGNGGLKAYLGANDIREIEKRINNGDEKANVTLEAMAYQVAKGIGQLATVLSGKVDAVILTGGAAYSERLTSWIKSRVAFIAPVEIMPGEKEMESLAFGTLRVLNGEESAREYTE